MTMDAVFVIVNCRPFLVHDLLLNFTCHWTFNMSNMTGPLVEQFTLCF